MVLGYYYFGRYVALLSLAVYRFCRRRTQLLSWWTGQKINRKNVPKSPKKRVYRNSLQASRNMSTAVLVLLYAYRTVTVVLRLVDFVRVILVKRVHTYYGQKWARRYMHDTRRLTRLSVSNRIKTMYDWLIIYLVTWRLHRINISPQLLIYLTLAI